MTRPALVDDLHRKLRLAYAMICIVAACWLTAIYHANRNAWQHSVADRYMLYYVGVLLAFAIGLILVGRWAEIAFAVTAGLTGIGFVIGAGLDWKTTPEATTNVPIGLVLMTPAACMFAGTLRRKSSNSGG